MQFVFVLYELLYELIYHIDVWMMGFHIVPLDKVTLNLKHHHEFELMLHYQDKSI
jgi:hypothetical protein